MDNGTMVETFMFLNYYQLAASSRVSKKFWTLICTHRRKLALLDVDTIFLNNYDPYHFPPIIKMFNKQLSPGEYKEWIVRIGYSKWDTREGQIAEKESMENVCNHYEFGANVYQNQNHCQNIARTVLYAREELKDETWPLFQHFVRLLMDPFINIRSLSLYSFKGVISLLAGAINPDRNRLHCEQLKIDFNDDAQKFIAWITNHVCCDEILIDGGLNIDQELLDLFLTGATCTSAINVIKYDLSTVIFDLVQEFTGLKNRDKYQIVESIWGNVKWQGIIKEFKQNFAEFFAKEEQYEESLDTRHVIQFINKDIERKLTLNVRNFSFNSWLSFSIEISNL